MRIILIVVAALTLIVGSALYTPAIEYSPRLSVSEDALARATPEQRVASFLLGSGYLPAAGTQVVINSATDRLAWHNAQGADSARRIRRLTIDHVRVASSAPLLWSLFSRSPITMAEVNARVQTADGQWNEIRFVLWQYGLLLTWPGNAADSVSGIWLPARVEWRA